MARLRIAGIRDVEPGAGRLVEAGGKTLALFNVDGTLHAIDNTCSHRGGPLAEGELDGPLVACPWHGWRWDVTTGANAANASVRLGYYPVTVEGDAVFVDL